MARAAKTTTSDVIQLIPLRQGTMHVRIVGSTPLILNSMSAKAKQQLLVGGRKKTAADKVQIKHNPIAEFRDSVETTDEGPTLLCLPGRTPKASLVNGCLETPGVTKAGAQRLIYIPQEHVPLWGVPELRMDVVRSADINKTPDIRTRAYLRQWCTEFDIEFVVPQLSISAVMTMLHNAGMLMGLCDDRRQKGGRHGMFRVLDSKDKDKEWDELTSVAARKAQQRALEHPQFANRETEDLMDFFFEEEKRRAG